MGVLLGFLLGFELDLGLERGMVGNLGRLGRKMEGRLGFPMVAGNLQGREGESIAVKNDFMWRSGVAKV